MANTKVQSEQIQDGSITADKLADGTIVAAELADNAVETAAINADAVTGAKIADNAIDSEHYTDGSIDTAHIADAQITVAKMAVNSVDSDQYVDGSIDTVHIGDSQVTTAKIANGNISTAKLADNSVTSAKLDTNIDIAGTFDVTGATTLDSTLAVAGISTFSESIQTSTSDHNLSIGMAEFNSANYSTFNLRGTTGGQMLLGRNSGANDWDYFTFTTDGLTRMGTASGDDLAIHTNSNGSSNERIRILSDGKVGVSTDSPSTKLEVNGGIRLSGLNGGDGLKFDLAGSSDFVIKESSTNDVIQIGALQHNISSNALGIGDAPDVALEVVTSDPRLRLRDNTGGGGSGNGGKIEFGGYHASSSDGARLWAEIHGLKNNSTGGDTHGDLKFLVNTGSVSPSEVGRFNFDGIFCVGDTTPLSPSPRVFINANSTSTNPALSLRAATYSGAGAIQIFFNGNGSEIGSVSSSNVRQGTSVIYNTSSDYRLKENITTLENGLDRLNKLKPVKFQWKSDGKEDEGFIAHEVDDVFPYAIFGEKDAVYEDGKIKPQGMDYGRITPLLVKAIQEQQTIIEDLKARIEALES